jgi:hypothetical protein
MGLDAIHNAQNLFYLFEAKEIFGGMQCGIIGYTTCSYYYKFAGQRLD